LVKYEIFGNCLVDGGAVKCTGKHRLIGTCQTHFVVLWQIDDNKPKKIGIVPALCAN